MKFPNLLTLTLLGASVSLIPLGSASATESLYGTTYSYIPEYSTNDGSQVGGYYSNTVSGFSGGLAFDASGNLFASRYTISGGIISEIAAGSTSFTTFSSSSLLTSLTAPLAFDASGNLFVGNGNTIIKITTNGVASTFLSSADFTSVSGLAFDASGNLFITTSGSYSSYDISKIAAGTTNVTASYYGGSLLVPDALAFDSKGNLFVANSQNGVISEIAAGTTNPTTFWTETNGGGALASLAFDGSGNLFVSDLTGSKIFEIATNGTSSIFVSNSYSANGLAFGPATAIPEPSTYALFGLGALALLIAYRRRMA